MELKESINKQLDKISNFYKLKNKLKKDLIKDLSNKLKEDLKSISDIKRIDSSNKKIFLTLTNDFTCIIVDFGLLEEKSDIEIRLLENTLKLENITIKNTRGFKYDDILVSIKNIIKVYNILLQHKEELKNDINKS